MAISDFQVGGGQYALAFGQHVVAGILAGHDDSVSNAVKIKVLLGLGEWSELVEVSYDGSIIDPSNYTFHPGTLSTGADDPLQGEDPRFPNDIYHSRIAYYTMTLPDGLGAEDRPDKMRVIAKTLKMNEYDEEGNIVDYKYSTNPADAFVEVVRRNAERLGLDFQDYIPWDNYRNAFDYYAAQRDIDTGEFTPQNVIASNTPSIGSLPTGTYYYRVTAFNSSGAGSESASGGIRVVEVTETGSGNIINWDEVEDESVTGYRIYFSLGDPTSFTEYFSVSGGDTVSFTHSTNSGASAGSPPIIPNGDWTTTEDRMQCHRAFTQTDILTGDALTAIMYDAASFWVRDGKKYRIILPTDSDISHKFTIYNTTPDEFSYWKVPIRKRANQIKGVFRNLDKNMKPDEQSPANNFANQSRVGIVSETANLGSMRTDQMRRITRWRLKDEHTLPRRTTLTGKADANHLLVGDIVKVVDRQSGKRNPYGEDFAASEGVFFSSLTPVTSGLSSGQVEWVGENPVTATGKSQSLLVTGNNSSLVEWSADISANPLNTAESSSVLIRVHINQDDENLPQEIAFKFKDDGANIEWLTLRLPQTTEYLNEAGKTTVNRIGHIPPKGSWIPVKIDLAEYGLDGITIVEIGGAVFGESRVAFSEWTYLDETGRDYRITEIESGESDSAEESVYTLKEFNPDAYDDDDGYDTI